MITLIDPSPPPPISCTEVSFQPARDLSQKIAGFDFEHLGDVRLRYPFQASLTWTMFLTLPFMAAIQIISACIGWQTRQGLARNIAQRLPRTFLLSLVGLLVIANTINIAADLAAMGEALKLVIGGAAVPSALC